LFLNGKERFFLLFYLQLKVMERKTKDEEENRIKQQKEKLITILSQVVTEKKYYNSIQLVQTFLDFISTDGRRC